MFPRILKYFIGPVVTFLVVWAGFIMWWQHAQIMPSYGDIVVALAAFPLVILLGFVVLKKTIDTARSRSEMAARPEVGLSSPVAAETHSQSSNAAGYSLSVLASRIFTPAGNDGESVWSFLSESQSKQELDRDLLEDEGISAFVAKMPSLDTSAAQQLLVVGDSCDQSIGYWAASDLRTFQLLIELAEEMVPECCQHLMTSKAGANHKDNSNRLFVKVFVPVDWAPQRCEWVSVQLNRILSSLGEGDAAASVSVRGVSRGIDVLKAIDDLTVEANSAATEDLFLVLAAGSAIEPANILRWHEEGTVLGAGRKGEIVPGEGAAGILLQVPALPPVGKPVQFPLLRRLVVRSDDESAKKQGRPSALGSEAAEDAIGLAGLQKTDIAAFVSDADRRTTRQAEVMGLASFAYPHIETPKNVISSGMAAGLSSVPLGLMAVSLAHFHVEKEGKAALVMSVQDECERGAVVVCPSFQQEYA